MNKPDWNLWGHLPHVLAWQACALSLDVEPDAIPRQVGWADGSPIFNFDRFPPLLGGEFQKRLRILAAHRANSRILRWHSYDVRPALCGVYLAEFAVWATGVVDWQVPEELAALAPRTEPDSAESEANPGPLARQRYQEEEILRVIKLLKHDPKRLPPNVPGKPGIKAAVRKELPRSRGTVFDKAWERLRKQGDIADND